MPIMNKYTKLVNRTIDHLKEVKAKFNRGSLGIVAQLANVNKMKPINLLDGSRVSPPEDECRRIIRICKVLLKTYY